MLRPGALVVPVCHAHQDSRGVYRQSTHIKLPMHEMDQRSEDKHRKQCVAANPVL
jgi:hypothetical protein